jgi:hypothetical protein
LTVYVPYTRIHPKTRAALDAHGGRWTPVDVSASHTAYFDALSRLWKVGDEDLIIVEHDVEITDQVVPSFQTCRRPWCTYSYACGADGLSVTDIGLGCVRFTRELRAAIPDLMDQVGRTPVLYPHDWRCIDGPLSSVLGTAGIVHHCHGQVTHHHHYSFQGCTCHDPACVP